MGSRKPINVGNKVVIIVDDGLATGNTVLAIINLLKNNRPQKIIVAVPVGPLHTIIKLKNEVDEVVCVDIPEYFVGVGQFYEEFEQVDDKTVIHLLEIANNKAFEFKKMNQ